MPSPLLHVLPPPFSFLFSSGCHTPPPILHFDGSYIQEGKNSSHVQACGPCRVIIFCGEPYALSEPASSHLSQHRWRDSDQSSLSPTTPCLPAAPGLSTPSTAGWASSHICKPVPYDRLLVQIRRGMTSEDDLTWGRCKNSRTLGSGFSS